ncbi:MAG: hypothetical protein OSJ59_19720 [Lachnospiraceae bacterium]|nr:hypothetical protein [Lachnospiraceae bacterium]
MDENMDYIPEESYTEDPAPDDTAVPEETGVEAAPPVQEEQGEPGDIEERIDDLLDQIGAGQSFGSMGDYYVAEAGCYAFPGEDVFFHFIDEEARSGWTAASNGCYVPADSLDAYEAYLSTSTPDEGTEEEGEGQEQLPPHVTQEDLVSLEGILNGIYAQEESFYQTSILHMESMEKTLADTQTQLYKTSVFLVVTCFFLAFLSGVKLADVFWSRMRAG